MKSRLHFSLIALFALLSTCAEGDVLVRELFDGLNGTLNGAGDNATSIGFAPSPWAANPACSEALTQLRLANDFNVSPDVTNAMPWQLGAGNANAGGIWWNGYDWDVGSLAMRPLSAGSRLQMGSWGVYYITFNLTYRNDDSLGFGFAATNGSTYSFISIGMNWNNTLFNNNASAKRLAVAHGDDISVWPGVSGATTNSATQVVNDQSYVVLVKITALPSGWGNDMIQAAFFSGNRPGYGLLPVNEADIVWDLTETFQDDRTYDQLVAFINGSWLYANLDSFRMGTSYADVAQVAPVITRQPSLSPSNAVYVGETVTMRVEAIGAASEPNLYQWYKADITGYSPIPGATNTTFSLRTSGPGDSGNYVVTVHNRVWYTGSIVNHLTVLPLTDWSSALVFDGVDDYMMVTNFGLRVPTNEVTVEFWQRLHSLQAQSTFSLDPDDYPTNRFQAHVPYWTSWVYWDFGDINNGGRLEYYPPESLVGTWQHFALTAKAGGEGFMQIYRNGVLEAEKIGAGSPCFANHNLVLGMSPGCFFDGELDEFRIWNVVRTPAQIQEAMWHPLNGTESNLVAYYRFDEGVGSTVQDITTNGMDGVLGGEANGTLWTNSMPTFFFNATPALVPGVAGFGNSSAVWGDFNNDERLDFLVAGITNGQASGGCAQLWQNTASGFNNMSIQALPLAGLGSVAWGDFDNDGRLDFLLTGTTNGVWSGSSAGAISQLWRNTGNGFAQVPIPGLEGVTWSSIAWGDYDNDGRLDFLITGYTGLHRVSQLWRNTGSGFVNVPIPGLEGVQAGCIAWGDYDNDGRLDFLLTGQTPTNGITSQLWRNTGTGFVNVPVPGLPGVWLSSIAWGDYDNDGRLDFLLAGSTNLDGTGLIAQIWRNTGSGFSNVTDTAAPSLQGVWYGSVAWGDYDNDGRLDFLLTGVTNSDYTGFTAQLWRNEGDHFARVPCGLPAVGFSTAAWADYDNDGRLDILLTGWGGDRGEVCQLWRNLGATVNNRPTPPGNLTVSATGQEVNLSWNRGADAETPASGLTYNLRVGTTPGGSDIVSPNASAAGERRLAAMGNAQQTFRLPLVSPSSGRIYWSVQAVDSAFAGSAFSEENSFSLWPVLTSDAGPPFSGDTNGDGLISSDELDAIAHYYWAQTSPSLADFGGDGLGLFQMTLPNTAAWNFGVEVSTDGLNWDFVGPASPTFQFYNPQATNYPSRFYRLSWH